MPLLVKARSFLRNLFLSRCVEADLKQEVHSHLELLTEENIRAGMPPKEAQRAARIELGGIEQVKEQVRERRIGNWLHSVISDCRYGVRQLRKNPGFAAVAILTLALGIGANTTIFSVVYAVLLKPLPYAHSEQLFNVFETNPEEGVSAAGWSYRNLEDLRGQNTVFSEIAGSTHHQLALTGRGEPSVVNDSVVTPELFSVSARSH